MLGERAPASLERRRPWSPAPLFCCLWRARCCALRGGLCCFCCSPHSALPPLTSSAGCLPHPRLPLSAYEVLTCVQSTAAAPTGDRKRRLTRFGTFMTSWRAPVLFVCKRQLRVGTCTLSLCRWTEKVFCMRRGRAERTQERPSKRVTASAAELLLARPPRGVAWKQIRRGAAARMFKILSSDGRRSQSREHPSTQYTPADPPSADNRSRTWCAAAIAALVLLALVASAAAGRTLSGSDCDDLPAAPATVLTPGENPAWNYADPATGPLKWGTLKMYDGRTCVTALVVDCSPRRRCRRRASEV